MSRGEVVEAHSLESIEAPYFLPVCTPNCPSKNPILSHCITDVYTSVFQLLNSDIIIKEYELFKA
jgi:hypothetical protein